MIINKNFELLKYGLSKIDLSQKKYKAIIFKPWCEDTATDKIIDFVVILNDNKSFELTLTTLPDYLKNPGKIILVNEISPKTIIEAIDGFLMKKSTTNKTNIKNINYLLNT